MINLYFGLPGLVMIFFSSFVLANEISLKIDGGQGNLLIKAALGRSSDGYTEENENGFTVYQIFGDGDCCGSSWYAVNMWTGDVWDLGGDCRQLSTPALRDMQKKIRKKFYGEEIKEYERLHNLKPYRVYDLERCGLPENGASDKEEHRNPK